MNVTEFYEEIIIKAMDHFREIKNNLSWHNEGKFEVELINNVISKLNFCEPGKGPEDSGKCLTSTNFKFLQSVYFCLGDLFNFIEEENKRLGYSYAREDDFKHPQHHDLDEQVYPALSDIKIRPLNNNYSNPTDGMTTSMENGELMRDIG